MLPQLQQGYNANLWPFKENLATGVCTPENVSRHKPRCHGISNSINKLQPAWREEWDKKLPRRSTKSHPDYPCLDRRVTGHVTTGSCLGLTSSTWTLQKKTRMAFWTEKWPTADMHDNCLVGNEWQRLAEEWMLGATNNWTCYHEWRLQAVNHCIRFKDVVVLYHLLTESVLRNMPLWV